MHNNKYRQNYVNCALQICYIHWHKNITDLMTYLNLHYKYFHSIEYTQYILERKYQAIQKVPVLYIEKILHNCITSFKVLDVKRLKNSKKQLNESDEAVEKV